MTIDKLGGCITFPGTPWSVHRVGYGAMQLAGDGVFGPPKDRSSALMGPFEPPLGVFVDLRKQGLIEHIGLSGVTSSHVDMAHRQTPIVCVQNEYNLANRRDDSLINDLSRHGIAYVPFFPLGGFNRLQSETLTAVAGELGVLPLQLAQAWLLQRSPNILLISSTSSIAHLRENLLAATISIPADAFQRLDGIAGSNGGVEPTLLPN